MLIAVARARSLVQAATQAVYRPRLADGTVEVTVHAGGGRYTVACCLCSCGFSWRTVACAGRHTPGRIPNLATAESITAYHCPEGAHRCITGASGAWIVGPITTANSNQMSS
eukprot:5680117-Prymnesium_polylepis.1